MSAHSLHSVYPVEHDGADRTELQRIAQLVEVNRDRLQALEQQVRNLEGSWNRSMLEALQSISQDGARGHDSSGAGVQLVVTSLLTEEL